MTESMLLSWYVSEEFSSGNELIPKDSYQRLKMRLFIDEVATPFFYGFYSTKKLNDKSEEDRKKVEDKILKNFSKF